MNKAAAEALEKELADAKDEAERQRLKKIAVEEKERLQAIYQLE